MPNRSLEVMTAVERRRSMHLPVLLWLMLLGSGLCAALDAPSASAAPLFETRGDREAHADLQRLAEAENRYWADHHTYTVSFAELGPAPFEPTPGIYVQVEAATPTRFRAIAMPRESHTARVFLVEAKEGHGGVTELGKDEVSTYVLGALKTIQGAEGLKLLLAALATLGFAGLIIYGIVLHRKGRAGQWQASLPYFLGVVTLYVTLILSTYVDEHTYIGPLVLIMAVTGAMASVSSILLGTITLWRSIVEETGFQFRRLALTGVLFALLGLVSPFYTFYPHLPWIGDLTNRPAAHRILPP